MMTKIIEVSVMEAQMESVQMTSISYYRTKIAIIKINNIIVFFTLVLSRE